MGFDTSYCRIFSSESAAKSAVNKPYDALIIEARKGNTLSQLCHGFAQNQHSVITKLLTGYKLPYGPGKINRLLPFTVTTVISNYQRVVMQLSLPLIVTCNNGKTQLTLWQRRALSGPQNEIINGDKF